MTVEEFLRAAQQPIHIVGGSPLFTGPWPCPFISINAKHAVPEAFAAAINGGKQDAERAERWQFVIQPNPNGRQRLQHAMQTENRIAHSLIKERGIQPTTFFCLAAICWYEQIKCELWGIDGWASRYHDGDLEMHHLKRMRGVTVHDPRTPW